MEIDLPASRQRGRKNKDRVLLNREGGERKIFCPAVGGSMFVLGSIHRQEYSRKGTDVRKGSGMGLPGAVACPLAPAPLTRG